ncbi:hypothetical protein J7643_06855 [bacterium]|nr:hypothetical protein [bacterium]
MGNWTIDLLTGMRTHELSLDALPFVSRLGAPDGVLRVVTDPDGVPQSVEVSLEAPKRFVVNALDRIAREASWKVPVEALRAAQTNRLVVDMVLKPEYVQELDTLDVDNPDLTVTVGWYPQLMDDHNYTIENIRDFAAPR